MKLREAKKLVSWQMVDAFVDEHGRYMDEHNGGILGNCQFRNAVHRGLAAALIEQRRQKELS